KPGKGGGAPGERAPARLDPRRNTHREPRFQGREASHQTSLEIPDPITYVPLMWPDVASVGPSRTVEQISATAAKRVGK
ncbi:hypothetical protein KUCAC02_032682, partial [Chaenocephalus aceratus]